MRFSSGTLALAVSGLLVKVLGMVYKIPLTNLLGDDGMGYFNAAYTVYTLFFVLATSGLPVALSLLVSEAVARGEEKRAGQLYRSAVGLFLAVGLLSSLMMALGARGFAVLLGNKSAAAGILAVSPTLAFMTFSGALRGYFQGRRQMTPNALSQVIEAGGKFVFGLCFAYLALSRFQISTVAAYAIFGLTLASFLATLSLFWAKKRFDKGEGYIAATCGTPTRNIRRGDTKRVLKIAFPVTLSASVMTLASSLDLFLVMRTLQSIGHTAEKANAVWGNYSALAVPLFNMPTVLILPIAYSVAPFVRGALARGEWRIAQKASLRALSLATCIAVPASLGLSLLSGPILSLLYSDASSVSAATPLLSVLALAVFPLALLSVTSSLLQAYGKLWFPIASIGVGIVVKLLVSYFGMLRYGMIATPIGTFLCYSVVSALNLAYLAKVSGGFSPYALLIKPFLAACPTAFAALISYRLFVSCLPLDKLATLFAIGVAVVVFLCMIALTKCVSEEDALALGLSEAWVERLKKIRILS